MSETELRDHAEDILTAIALDMSTAQTLDEQSKKSQGLGTVRTMAASGELHADDRMQHGFGLGAVLAEFRALRATVLRLYELSGSSDLVEVRRFNESVDEALTASITRFTVRTDVFRDQFVGVLSHDLRTPLGGNHHWRGALGGARGQPTEASESGGDDHQQRSAHAADDR
jgi:signal transduction histidine kinase